MFLELFIELDFNKLGFGTVTLIVTMIFSVDSNHVMEQYLL